MASYTIRPGFTIEIQGQVYQGGQEIELDGSNLNIHKHKLEGVERTVEPLVGGATGNLNSNAGSGSGYPAPYFSKLVPGGLITNATSNLTIEGSFFTPDIEVSLSSGTVNNIDFISSHKIVINLTTSSIVGTVDLTLDNGSSTVIPSAILVIDPPPGLVDLRLGGTPFSSAAIEKRPQMNFERTEQGLYFSGYNPWGSWARFVGDNDAWVWNRSEKKRLTWIFTNTNNMMVGIGSRANDPNTNSQFYQGEMLVYLGSGSGINTIYGNTGEPGTGRNLSFKADKNPTDAIAIVMSSNGEPGATISAYKLPNSDVSSWQDRSNKLVEVAPSQVFGDEPEIMPFVVPANGTGTMLLGFILEDEPNDSSNFPNNGGGAA